MTLSEDTRAKIVEAMAEAMRKCGHSPQQVSTVAALDAALPLIVGEVVSRFVSDAIEAAHFMPGDPPEATARALAGEAGG